MGRSTHTTEHPRYAARTMTNRPPGTVLGPEDLTRTHDAIARIGSGTTVEEFAAFACRELLELIPGLSASYNEVNPIAGRIAALVLPDPGVQWYAEYGELVGRLARTHPYWSYLELTDEGAPRTWDELDPAGEFEASELFTRFYAPNGIRSQLLFALPAPPGILVALAVNRDGEGFTLRERQLADLLRVHLVNLYRLTLRSDRLTDATGLLLAGGWTSVAVLETGEISATTPEAEQIGRDIGIGLSVGDSIAGTRLWEPPGRAQESDPWTVTRRARTFRVGGTDGAYDVMLVAASIGPHVLHLRAPTGVTLTSARDLGLTQRQAEVGLLVVEGATNDQIASRLQISSSTVRKHLEAIFTRLGVGSRAAVAATLMQHAHDGGVRTDAPERAAAEAHHHG